MKMKFIKVCILIVLVFAISCRKAKQKCDKESSLILPAVDYIFSGYNILYGSPFAAIMDPGIQKDNSPIFKASEKHVCFDNSYRVPENLKAKTLLQCSGDVKQSLFTDTDSYKQTISAGVKVEGETPKFSFSASLEYKNIQEKTSTSEKQFVTKSIQCADHQLQLNDEQTLAPKFLKKLNKLPKAYSKEEYCGFIDYFGTHYISSMEVGAIYGKTWTFNKSTFESSVTNSLQLKLGGGIGKIKAEVSSGWERTTSNSNSNQSESTYTFVKGEFGVSANNELNPQSANREKSMPIKLNIKPLYFLFDDEITFSNFSADKHPHLKNNFKQAIKEYCSWKSALDKDLKCEGFQTMFVVTELTYVEDNGNWASQTCDPGWKPVVALNYDKPTKVNFAQKCRGKDWFLCQKIENVMDSNGKVVKEYINYDHVHYRHNKNLHGKLMGLKCIQKDLNTGCSGPDFFLCWRTFTFGKGIRDIAIYDNGKLARQQTGSEYQAGNGQVYTIKYPDIHGVADTSASSNYMYFLFSITHYHKRRTLRKSRKIMRWRK